jgi:hypothetical protein
MPYPWIKSHGERDRRVTRAEGEEDGKRSKFYFSFPHITKRARFPIGSNAQSQSILNSSPFSSPSLHPSLLRGHPLKSKMIGGKESSKNSQNTKMMMNG